ncbi:uncharacterized protein JN550_005297 [Neoarthrinium moseri]|uniref:uncharacterized protein n=1 Tax=Neoarthrinium moseri TaxID=1658444 RepID=UPI001FDB92E9|nr:uncharacterized protein JN550_005297 [Neoarthrinium moseri]KAI1870369.1 hypothetical protein JN550_005297 [Neoarthrinium moseri]
MMAENPLPTIPSGTVGIVSAEEGTALARDILNKVNAAASANDAQSLADCFYREQSFWRDQLALTWHLRTFETTDVIVASFLETTGLRGVENGFWIDGTAQFVPATPVLQFIDCGFTFRTRSPAAACRGNLRLLPSKIKTENGSETVIWKIWILSTWIENLTIQPEDEALLESPKRDLLGLTSFETDVFILGGGNAAVALAARLKALGVESIVAERNARVGDNWALRYDSLRFHVPTSFCELPFMRYDKDLQTPHHLSKDELADHVRKYVNTYNLNIVTSATIVSTSLDLQSQLWHIAFETPAGIRSVACKHLVQATGFASQIPHIPSVAESNLYKGISIHSAHYKNAKQLSDHGAKSVLVVGSANTAFDVIEDCHAAGLRTTMVVRSPTYICPVEYVCDPRSLGVYDPVGIEGGDRLLMTGPAGVDAALARGLMAQMASEEPHRYDGLATAGFPVIDSRDPNVALMSNLLEHAGGHYIDIGATKLLAEGKVAVKAGVEPIAFTSTGLQFSDHTSEDADAIVWCTGFKDKNARTTAAGILGKSAGNIRPGNVLGPEDIAARLDATWGLDVEGEVRGLWKRQLRIDNYWTMGGYTQQHRWHSRTLALQIKAALEGIIPPAFRKTPHKKEKTVCT